MPSLNKFIKVKGQTYIKVGDERRECYSSQSINCIICNEGDELLTVPPNGIPN